MPSAGGFGEDDWDHALGGLHALVRDGYVEAVVVDPSQRRRGHAATVVTVLEDAIRRAYDLGALSLTPEGVVRTPDEDGTMWAVPATAELDPDGELTCDWRPGDLW